MRERALWRVLPYLRPHKKRLAFIAGSAVVSVGAQLAVPLIAEAAIDGPIRHANKRGLVPLLVLAVVLAIVELSLTYRRRLALSQVATSVETKLRDDFKTTLAQNKALVGRVIRYQRALDRAERTTRPASLRH